MEAHALTVRETVDARKQRFEADALKALFKDAKTVVVAKGKKAVPIEINSETDWEALAKLALGRSGNLRAPTVQMGERFLVGYSEGVWEAFFQEA